MWDDIGPCRQSRFEVIVKRCALAGSTTKTRRTSIRHLLRNICAMVKSRYIGDGHPTLNRNPYNGYINLYYWVDDHPLLYGTIGSLDPSTYDLRSNTVREQQQLFVYSTRLPRTFVQILLIQSMQKTCKEDTFFGRWSIRIAATNWCIESGRGVACASISWSLVPPCSVSGCCKQVLLSVKCSLFLCVGWSCVVCIVFLPFQSLKLLLSSGTS